MVCCKVEIKKRIFSKREKKWNERVRNKIRIDRCVKKFRSENIVIEIKKFNCINKF